MNPAKKLLSLILALALCAALALPALAGGEGCFIKIHMVEVDEDGNPLRETFALLADGVIESTYTQKQINNAPADFYEDVAIPITLKAPDGSVVNLTLTGGASNAYGLNYNISAQMDNPQLGTYTLTACDIPQGYERVEANIRFTITQQELDDGLVSNDLRVSIIKTGETTTPNNPAPAALTATPTASAVTVNGESVAFDAYNIEGNNYFKLRDLAFVLSGSAKQFAVDWDAANQAILLTSGGVYAPNGSEMAGKGAGSKTPVATTAKIVLDGHEVALTAYNIEGNNYFKLRDIGQAFDFSVAWDDVTRTIAIDTAQGYTP